ncbi:MAG: hypothetical protein HYR60_28895 [Acidobacteria bacterium]|nr:hypothetical protein [Acidobacteriota bacterium]
MKRFRFSLDRVLSWRRQQLELEQSRLAALLAELTGRIAHAGRLEREQLEVRRRLCAEPQELAAGDNWLRCLAGQLQQTRAEIAAFERRIQAQQTAVRAARRAAEVLERLKQRRFGEWQAALDREEENLAGELYLARWKKG